MAYTTVSVIGQPANFKTPLQVTYYVADFANEAALTAIVDDLCAAMGAYARYEDGILVDSAATETASQVNAAPLENSTLTCGWITLKFKGQAAEKIEIPVTMYDIQGFIDALWATGKLEFMNYYYRAFNNTVGAGSYGTNLSNHNTPIAVTK